jgi:hypothetical protein
MTSNNGSRRARTGLRPGMIGSAAGAGVLDPESRASPSGRATGRSPYVGAISSSRNPDARSTRAATPALSTSALPNTVTRLFARVTAV